MMLETNRWGLAFFFALLFLMLLFLTSFRKKTEWQSHGAYVAFVIALFTEMFGVPLTIYFVSSYFSWQNFQEGFLSYVSEVGRPFGFAVIGVGVILVIFGWGRIHAASGGLVTDGIYSHVRHPQYLGLILVTGGWLIYWPTISTALMWPLLVGLYYRLARKEEQEMMQRLGKEYATYVNKVPMIIPIPRLNK